MTAARGPEGPRAIVLDTMAPYRSTFRITRLHRGPSYLFRRQSRRSTAFRTVREEPCFEINGTEPGEMVQKRGFAWSFLRRRRHPRERIEDGARESGIPEPGRRPGVVPMSPDGLGSRETD